MISRSTIARSARNAALIAAIFAGGILLSGALRNLGKPSPVPVRQYWLSAALVASVMSAAVFFIFFIWSLISAARAQPVYDIFEEETPESELTPRPLYGFVAMEFYWVILNRTFVVIAAPDGFYGWKAEGPVTNANRRYFEAYQEMLKDEEFTRDLPAIRKLAELPGGFIYPASGIASIASDDRRQWGMGGIPHAGHLQVRFTSGTTRKLILLGEVIPDEVRDRILATLGTGITSMVQSR